LVGSAHRLKGGEGRFIGMYDPLPPSWEEAKPQARFRSRRWLRESRGIEFDHRNQLLSHAECLKDDVKDVIGVSGAGDQVQGPQRVIKVQQEQLMMRLLLRSLAGLGQTPE